jgi:UDPglucose 6-dehydrogenase
MGTRVAVIGVGVVGRAQVRLLGDLAAVTWDPAHGNPYPRRAVDSCDLALICAGTPEGRGGAADLSQVQDALDQLPACLPALIRSTIPPGTMGRLEKENSRTVGHWPEFLNERPGGPWQESADVPFAILGGTPAAHETFGPLITAVHSAPYLCTGLEAELAKYAVNCHLAVKVTFANEMAAICEALGADWEHVRAGWVLDPRAGTSHSQVIGPGGYGGRCLPKDMAALSAAARAAGYEPRLLAAVRAANSRFRQEP